MAIDRLADALNTIKTHEMVGQRDCAVPASRLIGEILNLLKSSGYITDYKLTDNGRGGRFNVSLAGKINNCGVITPRFPVKRVDWAVVEQQYIPGVGIGLLIVSTPQGIMTNSEADKRHIGGRLLAYIY